MDRPEHDGLGDDRDHPPETGDESRQDHSSEDDLLHQWGRDHRRDGGDDHRQRQPTILEQTVGVRSDIDTEAEQRRGEYGLGDHRRQPHQGTDTDIGQPRSADDGTTGRQALTETTTHPPQRPDERGHVTDHGEHADRDPLGQPELLADGVAEPACQERQEQHGEGEQRFPQTAARSRRDRRIGGSIERGCPRPPVEVAGSIPVMPANGRDSGRRGWEHRHHRDAWVAAERSSERPDS